MHQRQNNIATVVAGKTGYTFVGNKIKFLSLMIYKQWVKQIQNPNVRPEAMKLQNKVLQDLGVGMFFYIYKISKTQELKAEQSTWDY